MIFLSENFCKIDEVPMEIAVELDAESVRQLAAIQANTQPDYNTVISQGISSYYHQLDRHFSVLAQIDRANEPVGLN